jgi:serine phosphatase RsbU (regulator of sigma subunit)
LELKQKNIKFLLNCINYLFSLLIILGLFLIIFYRNKFFELHYYANIFIVLALLIFLIIILSRILYYDIDAIYLLIGSTAVFISGFLELGIYFRIFNFINVFHIGCLIFLFFNFIVLSKKYWNTYQKLEESNKILKEQQKQIELLQNLKDEFFIELSNKIIFPIEDIISLLKNIEIDLSEKEMLIKLLDNLRRETNRIKNLLTYERNEFNLESLELNIIEYLKNIHFLTSQNENKNLEVFIPQVKEAWILFNHEILIEIFNELFFYSSGNIKILVDIQTNNDKEYIIIQINSENIYMYPENRNYFQPYLKIDFLETTGLYLVYKYMKYFNGNFEYSINHSEIKFILYFPLINTINQQIENSNQILSKKEKNSFILKSSIRKEIPKIIFLYDDPIFLKKIYNILKSDYYIFCTNDTNVVIEELKSEYDIFIFPPILFGNPILSFFKDIRKQYDPFSLIAILLNPVSNVKWEEYQNFGIQDIIIIEKNKVNEEEIKLKLFNYILLKKYYKKYLDYLKYQNDINILSEFQNHFYKDYSLYKNSIEYDIKYLAADQISGDLVEIYKKSESEIIFIIGDITGHGLYAAFFSIFLRMLITIYLQENPKILGIDLLKKINKMIINYFNKQLATLSLLFIDIQNKILKFYRAGHLPALYYKKNSNEFIELFPRGKILGVSENANWEELMIHYNLGDRIFLFTDGLIETAFENNRKKIYNLIKENNHKLRIDDLSNMIFSEVIKNKSYKEKFIEDDITSIFIELK